MYNLGVTIITAPPINRIEGSRSNLSQLDQSLETENGAPILITSATSAWQSFTSSKTGLLTRIAIYRGNNIVQSGDRTATLNIYSGEGTGGTLLTSQAITITNGNGWKEFDITSPPSLTANSIYTINITGSSASWYWSRNNSNVYTGGRSDIGASDDYLFRTYMQVDLLLPISSSTKSYYSEISTYTHTIQAWGGFDTCSFSLILSNIDSLIDWLLNGIGNHITCFAIDTTQIWEGFVNEINFNIGSSNISVGPYTEISNRILIKYTEYSTGVPGVTTYLHDTDSQEIYGILTKIISSGSISAANSSRIQTQYLAENSKPKFNHTINIGESQISITINCLGYQHLLTYNYNSTNSGSTASDKIISVLSGDPNSMFSDFSKIQNNGLSVNPVENEDRLAKDIIKEITSLGSPAISLGTDDLSGYSKVLFGIYENRVPFLTQVELTPIYFYYTNDVNTIYNKNGDKIYPYSIRPGHLSSNLDMGFGSNDMLFSSYGNRLATGFYIESVNFTAPNSVQMQTRNTSDLETILNKLGIGGIG